MITLSLLCAPALHGKSVRDRGFQHRSRDSVPAKETSGDTAQAPTQVGHTTQASSSGKKPSRHSNEMFCVTNNNVLV